MPFFSYFSLLRQHKFSVNRRAWLTVAQTFAIGLVVGILARIQALLFSSTINRQVLSDPVFIIGHWRSGTTFLHELISLDSNHTSPNTYECFNPGHFLLTERQFRRSNTNIVETTRPMDAMTISITSPQEDEFAAISMGLPSPYEVMLFPNDISDFYRRLSPTNWTEKERLNWKHSMNEFLQGISLIRPGRMILKSPTHSFRIGFLMKVFPSSHFIHIVRNPCDVYISTKTMWQEMFDLYGLQTSTENLLNEMVLKTGLLLEDSLRREIPLIPANRYHLVKYENLVTRPIQEIEKIYSHFSWAISDEYRSALQSYISKRSSYKASGKQPTIADKPRLLNAWLSIFQTYDYPIDDDITT
jgi:omega-hydroxy-beta-dihydromenaquinone-9 sulfotransferase